MNNETVTQEQPTIEHHTNPLCQICGKERKLVDTILVEGGATITKTDLVDPFCTIITCKEHREYQYMNNLYIAKALAGFGDGTYDEKTIQMMREYEIAQKQKYKDIIQLIKDNIAQPHADEIVSYINRHVREYAN